MTFSSYLKRLDLALNSITDKDVSRAVQLFKSVASSGKSIWFMGNGGSAATSNHAAIDLLKVFESCGIRAQAHSLVSNGSILTAVANDISYEEIFSIQIRNMAKEGDLIVAISASGNSTNLVRGIEEASKLSCRTLSLLGFNGGILQSKSEIALTFQTQLGDYGVSEDCHSVFLHFVAETLRESLLS